MPFDKVGNWKPNKKQEIFLSLPDTIKEGFYGGGAGSGKSELLLVYPLIRKWYLNPRFKQLFARRTYPEIRNEILPRSREFYPKFGATFNKADMMWTFPRTDQYGSGYSPAGAIILMGHCENEQDVSKYDTMEINLFTPDELTSFTEFIYLYIGFTRVRSSDPELPAVIRAAGMPGGIGHSFVNKRFVKPDKKGGKVIIGRGGNKRIFIFATQADNPHIDPTYSQSLEALPEAEKKAKKYGDFDAYLGQVFTEFRDRHYPDEPDYALHVIPEFQVPHWWPRVVVGDWGFAAMTYIAYAAISPNRRVYIYREQHWLKTKIEEWGPYVKYNLDLENPRLVKFCKSAGVETGQEQTIQEQISKSLGRPIDLAANHSGTRVAGKILLHEYLRWTPKAVFDLEKRKPYNEEYAQWIFRNRGIKEYQSYIDSFNEPEPETNLPKLLIFDCCPLLVESIKACTYDKPKDNKPAEDVMQFEGDDPYDAIRYLLDSVERYFDESAYEFHKIQQQQQLSDKLSDDGNWTAFYMSSRKIDSIGLTKPIRRYHHKHQ
jgi:hypothetical protein